MKKLFLVIFSLSIVFSACEDLIDLNNDPNNVSETHPRYLLTEIEWQTFQVAGASPLFATRMIVQTDGESAEQYYTWNRGSFSEYSLLRSVVKMMEESEKIGNTTYIALGKFFKAYHFYQLTLRFGDIPYSQALKGESEKKYFPEYDKQEDVFIGILQELQEADNLLENDDNIIAGDIIFNGSTLKWRKLINSFRLKVLLTLSKKEDDSRINIKPLFSEILTSKPIMESINDNAQLVFLDVLGSRYTEFNSSSYGSARYMDSTFVRRLQDRQDPRLFIFAGQTKLAKEAGLSISDFNAYEGGNPIAPYNNVNIKASAGKVSKVNERYTTDPVNEPHMLLGFAELQFILAEAAVKGWIAGNAQTYYNNGVRASFLFYRLYAEEYSQYVTDIAASEYLLHELVSFTGAVSDADKIQRIQMQKYLQSFLQGGWTMYYENLRTDYPEFAVLSGVTRPLRWMYPTSEYQRNAKNVATAITRQFGEGNDNTRQSPWWIK